MRCPNCGKENSEEYKYCYDCGEDLTREEVKVVNYNLEAKTKVIITVAMMLISVFFLTGVSITFSRKNTTEVNANNNALDASEEIVNVFTCSKVGNDINEVIAITHRDGEVLEYAKEYTLNTYGMTNELVNNLVARFGIIDNEISAYKNEVGVSYAKEDRVDSVVGARVLTLNYSISPKKVQNKKVFNIAKYSDLEIADIVRSYKNEGYDCK